MKLVQDGVTYTISDGITTDGKAMIMVSRDDSFDDLMILVHNIPGFIRMLEDYKETQ